MMEGMSLSWRKHLSSCHRYFSTSNSLFKKIYPKKRYIKYKTRLQEPHSERNEMQLLANTGKKLIPYDKNLPITGKNTGPSVQGGSELAQKLAANHVVPATGYINKYGRFIPQENMKPNFVVPDLTNCKLKPYISYRTVEVNQTKFTAEDLYRALYKNELEEDMKLIEVGKPLEEVIAERLKKMDESTDELSHENSDVTEKEVLDR